MDKPHSYNNRCLLRIRGWDDDDDDDDKFLKSSAADVEPETFNINIGGLGKRRVDEKFTFIKHFGDDKNTALKVKHFKDYANATTSPPLNSRCQQHHHLDHLHRHRHRPYTKTRHLDSFRLQRDYTYPPDDDEIFYENRGRDILKPNFLDQRAAEMPYRSHLTPTNNMGLSRSPAERPQYHLDTETIHSRLGRKVLREDEMSYPYPYPYPYPYIREDPEIELHYDYHYRHERDPGSHKERMRSFPPSFLHEREHNMDDHHDSSSRYLKRKYTMEDEENRIPSTSSISRLETVNTSNNQYYRDEEWIDEDAIHSRRTQKVYYDDALIYDPTDEFIHDHDHHTRSRKYAKGYSRSSGQVGYNSYHSNRRNGLPRWKNEPIRSENDDMYSRGIEPHEDTMEFKELVNDYFLSFTKKLNENPVVRRRYMEQGSLFCIVCGRSMSKEFLDTKRLAMHAFMSHKGGLRAQHLGLLKAICVMLGWNSLIPADTPRWFPESLSATQTLAQKQDLIIWPPLVIVHNISILNNNTSNGEGPTTVEALGQYLRGIGLSGGGKVKLGKPGNCSIMVVKFLGTFSGLQDAEKIHQYFSKKKNGRKQLEQISWGKGKSSNSEVLFGYMGIAEDLDKVDMDTKRKSSIKSKKEIQDIADAPVKSKPATTDSD